MDYRRYALGTYESAKWIECTECGSPERPVFVWESHERAANFAFVVNAVMQHEIAAHASKPTITARRNR